MSLSRRLRASLPQAKRDAKGYKLANELSAYKTDRQVTSLEQEFLAYTL